MDSTIISISKEELEIMIVVIKEKPDTSFKEWMLLRKLKNILWSMEEIDIGECVSCRERYEMYCFAGEPHIQICCMLCSDDCAARCAKSLKHLNAGGLGYE